MRIMFPMLGAKPGSYMRKYIIIIIIIIIIISHNNIKVYKQWKLSK